MQKVQLIKLEFLVNLDKDLGIENLQNPCEKSMSVLFKFNLFFESFMESSSKSFSTTLE